MSSDDTGALHAFDEAALQHQIDDDDREKIKEWMLAKRAELMPILDKDEQLVDVIFWAVIPEDKFNVRPKDFDLPKGAATTVPYYKDEIVHLAVKK